MNLSEKQFKKLTKVPKNATKISWDDIRVGDLILMVPRNATVHGRTLMVVNEKLHDRFRGEGGLAVMWNTFNTRDCYLIERPFRPPNEPTGLGAVVKIGDMHFVRVASGDQTNNYGKCIWYGTKTHTYSTWGAMMQSAEQYDHKIQIMATGYRVC